MNFTVLYDRDAASTVKAKGLQLFRRLGLIYSAAVDTIHFCGVVVSGGEVYAVLPRNSHMNSLSPCSAASLLLRVLSKYNTASEKAIVGGINDEDDEGLGLLANILWLLSDYSAHGLYSTSGKKRHHDHGKINWSRTISCETPVEGFGGVPVYPILHTESILYGQQSQISLIQADVLRKLDNYFCWAITGDPQVRVAPGLDSVPSSDLTLEAKLYLLQKELASVYVDRHVRLLNTLIQFLRAEFTGGLGDYVVGVKTFQNVWEEMLRNILPGVTSVNNLLPKPALFFKDVKKPSFGKGMVTDIVCAKEGVVSVVDAKYYNAHTVSDSPGWQDLVKQFFYAKAASIVFPDSIVANWFIFPGQFASVDSGPIRSMAVVDKLEIAMEEHFQPIGCLYFCPVKVMNMYVSSKKYAYENVPILFSRCQVAGEGLG